MQGDMPGSSSAKTVQGFALGDQTTFFGALFLFNNQDSVWEEDDWKAINMVETSYSVLWHSGGESNQEDITVKRW